MIKRFFSTEMRAYARGTLVRYIKNNEIDPTEAKKRLGERDMYAVDLRAFCADVEKSLCELEYFLTNMEMAEDKASPAKKAAFHINKIRGAAELRQVPWLASVAAQFERGMHTVADSPKSAPLKTVIDVHFRAVDSIRNFIVGLEEGVQDGDDDILATLEKCTEVFGKFGDEATQDQIDGQLKELFGDPAPAVEEPTATASPEAVDLEPRPTVDLDDLSILEGKKVLVVDDDVIIRNILCNYVRSQGMEACQAEDGRAGYRQLRISASGYDIAIVDLHMPRMDGFELVTAVRKDEKIQDLNILIFTASLHMKDVHRAISLGVQGYLLKRQWKERILKEMVRILHESEIEKTKAGADAPAEEKAAPTAEA